MPFDGRDYSTRIDALEKIDRVIEQLPSEDRWCKGALYTVDGRRCILGAMQAVNGAMVLKQPILQAIQEVTGRRYTAIETFNDRRTTTHAQVVAVLHRARQDILADFLAPPARRRVLERAAVRPLRLGAR
jgi:hypothetical protein